MSIQNAMTVMPVKAATKHSAGSAFQSSVRESSPQATTKHYCSQLESSAEQRSGTNNFSPPTPVQETMSQDHLPNDTDFIQRFVSFLNGLDMRERLIIQLRFGLDGCRPRTLDEVSHMIHRTRERVRQLQNQALAKLRAKLEGNQKDSEAIAECYWASEPERKIECYWVFLNDGQKLRFEDKKQYRDFILEHQKDVLYSEVEFKNI